MLLLALSPLGRSVFPVVASLPRHHKAVRRLPKSSASWRTSRVELSLRPLLFGEQIFFHAYAVQKSGNIK